MAKKRTVREEREERVEKKKKERFEVVPTHLRGIQLRVEPGTKLDILRSTIENLYQLAREYARIHWGVESLTEQQKSRREEIIEEVKEYEGLRGLISEEENFVLTAVPKEKITWHRKSLEKSLGIIYPAIAREDLLTSVLIPAGFVTEKGSVISEEVIRKAIAEALVNLGISEKDTALLMRQEVKMTIDEGRINEMVSQGKVKLLPGTKAIDITWAIKVDKLQASRKALKDRKGDKDGKKGIS